MKKIVIIGANNFQMPLIKKAKQLTEKKALKAMNNTIWNMSSRFLRAKKLLFNCLKRFKSKNPNPALFLPFQ